MGRVVLMPFDWRGGLVLSLILVEACGRPRDGGSPATVASLAGPDRTPDAVIAPLVTTTQEGQASGPVEGGRDFGSVVFFDDFNGTALGSAWTAINRAGDYGNREQECYAPSQVSVTGGDLVVTTTSQTHVCGDEKHPPSAFPFLSGMVQWTAFRFLYGTVEFRARTSGGRGSWPAVWLLGAACQASNISTSENASGCNWPNRGSEEIDVLEILNSDYTTVHHNVFTSAGTDECSQPSGDSSQDFHVYRMQWSSKSLTFEIDGKLAHCGRGPHIPTSPMFLIINTAVASSASAADAPFRTAMQVDYVKVTQP
jgi:beta-glucanase (GH16 family)